MALRREQRCWSYVQANVLAALPKSAQPGAKAALAEIYGAEDREHALAAVTTFVADYGAKWPKAVAKVTDNVDVLLEFYNYSAEPGCTCAPRIPSNRPSPRSGCASG